MVAKTHSLDLWRKRQLGRGSRPITHLHEPHLDSLPKHSIELFTKEAELGVTFKLD